MYARFIIWQIYYCVLKITCIENEVYQIGYLCTYLIINSKQKEVIDLENAVGF